MRNSYAPLTILTGAAVIAVALVAAGATMTVAPGKAQASAAIASQTGLPCTKCHTAPPKLNAYGQNYKKKGR
jgi:cytochrome c553